MKVTKKDLLLLGIVFLVLLAADQITKAVAFAVMGENAAVTMVIPGFLGFNTVLNEGISFSIGEGGEWTQPIVIAITAAASIVIAVLICKIPKRRLLLRYALVLILAGAVGNLIDRIAMQAVRDFIYMNFGFVDFSNNVADLEITVGAVMLIICLLFVDEEAIFRSAPKEAAVQEGKGEALPAQGAGELPAEKQGEVAEPAPQTGDGEQGAAAESAPQTGDGEQGAAAEPAPQTGEGEQGETAAGIKTQPAEISSSKTEEEPASAGAEVSAEEGTENASSKTEEEPASAGAEASAEEGTENASSKTEEEPASSASDTKEETGEPRAPQAGHGNA